MKTPALVFICAFCFFLLVGSALSAPTAAEKQVDTVNQAVQALQEDNKRLRARLEELEDLPTAKKELLARRLAEAAARAAARDR